MGVARGDDVMKDDQKQSAKASKTGPPVKEGFYWYEPTGDEYLSGGPHVMTLTQIVAVYFSGDVGFCKPMWKPRSFPLDAFKGKWSRN